MDLAQRTQADNRDTEEFYGALTALNTRDMGPSLTRQEQAKEADVNHIVAKFGINAFATPMIFGEVNFTRDLQQSLHTIANAKRWWSKLPDALKGTYPTWESLLEAADNGTLTETLKELSKPPETPKPPAEPAA